MRFPVALPVAAGLALLLIAAPVQAQVEVVMHDGLVSVNAKDTTVRQILAEWGKVGQTRFINAEEIVGGPLTLQLTDVPETQALDIVLRSVSGYLAAPRPTVIANASRFDRILVMPMPAAAPARSIDSAGPSPFSQPRPVFPQGSPSGGPGTPASDDQSTNDTRNTPPPAPPLGQQRGAVFNTFAPTVPPDNATPPAQLPSVVPTAPGGVSTPGMIVQPAPQPGQVVAPGQRVQPGQVAPGPTPG